jgi:hypothetical protein
VRQTGPGISGEGDVAPAGALQLGHIEVGPLQLGHPEDGCLPAQVNPGQIKPGNDPRQSCSSAASFILTRVHDL